MSPTLPITWSELSQEQTQKVKETCPSSPLNDLIKYEPGPVLVPRTYLQWADRVYNFELREDDIWIVTYPKSGTTWSQEMLWMIINDVDKEGGRMPLFTRTPFLEMGCLAPAGELDKAGPADNLPDGPMKDLMSAFFADPIVFTENMKGRRVIKSHMPLEFLPPQVLDKCKVVYVARNVKDTAVSYYHHCLNFTPHDFQGSFTDFIDMFKSDLSLYGSYWHHVLGGWKLREHKNLKFVWFEDMKTSQKSVIEEVCYFVQHPLSEEKMDELVEHLKFENFKKNPSISPPRSEAIRMDFIRKGEVGDWKNFFTEEKTKEWNLWIEEKTKGTGMVQKV